MRPIADKPIFHVVVREEMDKVIHRGTIHMVDLFKAMNKEQYACAQAGQLQFFMDYDIIKPLIHD